MSDLVERLGNGCICIGVSVDEVATEALLEEAAARITALEAEIEKALERLEASLFTNAEHKQAADILRAALAGGE